MFLNPFQPAFGLDIGDRAIKIAQLKRSPIGLRRWRFRPVHFSKLALPAGWIVDGELQKPEEIVRTLKEHIQKQKDGLAFSPWVVACLPETKTFIQLIKVENRHGIINEDVIREILPSFLPYNLDDVYLDWQVLPQDSASPNLTPVLIAAAPKRIADSYNYLLNIAGLTPLAFEVEAAAIARAVINRRKDLSREARGILDLGATRSSFIIFDHGVIQFSLSLPFAGQEVTEKIRQALNVEWAEAEKLKTECGLDEKKCRRKLKEILQTNLDDLTDKIFQAIQFHKLHFPDRHPLTGIRLCGGGANLPALENYLSAKLKLKVRRANPWVNLFPPEEAPLDAERSLFYATAIGLAMRAVETPLNF